ncbi:sulfatase-like hydrolase/transferase [Halorubrum sp. RMP-47]|uniref:Sulfatase-like hydrolase/transferase n=1 Tax=Halorubrum miltondacostae TaxID=3076378 RepID=A0ABD5M0Y2_9EURY
MTNIAVVVLDTVRADAFGEAFEWLPGTWFDAAYSTSHWTGGAHASLFTGMYPSEADVTVADWALSTPERTLAEQLSAAGYRTRAFSANINVSPAYGYDRGFDVFDGTRDTEYPTASVFNWYRHLEENEHPRLAYLTGAAAALRGDYDTGRSLRFGLAEAVTGTPLGDSDAGAGRFRDLARSLSPSGPTFLFANLMEAHQPYRAPPAYRSSGTYDLGPAFEATLRNRFDDPDEALADGVDREHTGPDPERARAAYEDCVRYLSDVYREAFEALSARFDYVITLGDHGELFGEHGVWEHGYGLYSEVTNVPLVVTGPEFSDERVDAPVSLLDVYHTVLALADGTGPNRRGRDLRTANGDRGVTYLTEYNGIASMRREALRERGYAPAAIDAVDVEYRGLVADGYYGFQSDEGWIETGESPTETPQEELAALREEVPDNRDGDETGPVDPEIRERLEELGYA